MTDLPVGLHEREQITPVPVREWTPQTIAGMTGIQRPDTAEEQLAILLFQGTAEHGIGKLKSEYLVQMYGREGIMEMVRVKKALDPYLVLNIGNMIAKEYFE